VLVDMLKIFEFATVKTYLYLSEI